MKLQEVAFMVSLINANYHRRMLYFWGNIVFLIAAIAVTYYNLFIVDSVPAVEVKAALLRIFFWILVLIAATLRTFIIYALGSDDNELGSSLPWSIKKDQMTALKQHVEAKGDFEDLQCLVPLHEYFEM